jgi:hypothetical protein
MLMTDQQASELAKPGVGSFDGPTPLVAPQCSAIRIAPLLAILPVRGDQLDAAATRLHAERRLASSAGLHCTRAWVLNVAYRLTNLWTETRQELSFLCSYLMHRFRRIRTG